MISRNSLTDAYPKEQLGNVVDFLDSMRRPVTESDRRAGEYPYYGANGLQGTIDNFIFDEPLLLLAEDGGHFGTPDRGIAYRVSGKTWVNNHAHVLRPKECVDLGFLCRVLENYDVTPWVTGTTRGKLTQAEAAQIVVPLPPLSEQRRIAEILDKADALRAKRRAALAQLGTLTQSVFLDMFGDPSTNPKGWPVRRLSDVLSVPLRNGLSPSHAGRVSAKVLTLSAITGNEFDTDAWKISTFQLPPPSDRSVQEDDFLICRGNGNLRLVGKGFFPTRRMPDVTFPDTMIAARISPERVGPVFLQYVWNSPAVRRQIESVARTTNGTLKVNQSMLEEVGFVMPPRPLQDDFARCVAAVANLKETHGTALAKLDCLFASLQHRAFRGEL